MTATLSPTTIADVLKIGAPPDDATPDRGLLGRAMLSAVFTLKFKEIFEVTYPERAETYWPDMVACVATMMEIRELGVPLSFINLEAVARDHVERHPLDVPQAAKPDVVKARES